MSKVTLTDDERKVLQVYADLDKADPEGAWASYYADVGNASPFAASIVKNLKKRGLLTTNDKRVNAHSSYWITDKGKEALAA